MEKYLIGATAALFGWIVISIPKILEGKVTWLQVLAHSGVALLVGFVSMSGVELFTPITKQNLALCTSISAIAGSVADNIIILFQNILMKVVNNKFLKKGE